MILGRAEVVITRRITIYARRGHDTDIDKDINFVDQTLKCKKSWTSNRQPGHKPESTRYLVKNESEHFLNIEFLGTGSAGYFAHTVTAMKIDNILQRMWGVRCQQFWQHLLEWRWLDEGNVSHRAWSPAMVVNEQNINVTRTANRQTRWRPPWLRWQLHAGIEPSRWQEDRSGKWQHSVQDIERVGEVDLTWGAFWWLPPVCPWGLAGNQEAAAKNFNCLDYRTKTRRGLGHQTQWLSDQTIENSKRTTRTSPIKELVKLNKHEKEDFLCQWNSLFHVNGICSYRAYSNIGKLKSISENLCWSSRMSIQTGKYFISISVAGRECFHWDFPILT